MPPKPRATKDQVKQVVELSKTKTIKEIGEITGLSKFVVNHIQIREKVENPFRKNKVRKLEPEGEYFDIDQYSRKYIC